jgi:hypothetical protein
VLAHWNKSLTIDITLHSETLSWFRANHSLLLLLNAACLAEKQHIPNPIVFGLTRPWLESTISHTQSKHASHYTTGAVTFFYVYNTFLDGRPNWNFNGKFVEICVQLTIIICIINFMYICFLQACMEKKNMQSNLYPTVTPGQRKNDLTRQMATYSRSADTHSGSICWRADMYTIIQKEN